jgi:hypothetical protein
MRPMRRDWPSARSAVLSIRCHSPTEEGKVDHSTRSVRAADLSLRILVDPEKSTHIRTFTKSVGLDLDSGSRMLDYWVLPPVEG